MSDTDSTTPTTAELTAIKDLKYAHALIFTIRSKSQKDKYFIGGTVQQLSQKMHTYRKEFNKLKPDAEYISPLNKLLGADDAYIELLESFPCKNKLELDKRIGELIREHSAAINHISDPKPKKPKKDAKTI